MSSLQAALDKCKAANASLQADLEEVIFETAEEQKQVSFKLGDSDSYCPDFELCLMQVLSQTSYNKAFLLALRPRLRRRQLGTCRSRGVRR